MKDPKKILYINNFFTKYGGAENTIYRIANLMQRKGIEIYFFCTNKQPYFFENYEYEKYFPEYKDKRTLSVKNITGFLKTFYNFEVKNNLKKYLEEIKPDLVSIHNIHYHLTPAVFDACEELKIPIVFYLHDPRSFCPGGTLSYGGHYCNKEYCIKGNPFMCIINKCKLNSLKGSILSSLYYLYFRSKNIFNRVDAVFCPSRAIAELAIRSGVNKEKIYQINNFIEENIEKENKETVLNKQEYFLYVGRIDSEKGINYLIEAMKTLQKDIALHIVGSGTEEEHFKKIAAENGLPNIKFLGYKTGKELEEQYKNCIATILPCNWFENFPRSILESFVHGKPSIASRVGGIPEMIDDGENGYIFEAGQAEKLSELIKAMFSDKELSASMGEKAREKAFSRYNAEDYSNRIINIYKNILNKY